MEETLKRAGPEFTNTDDLIDTLIAISGVAKRLATKLQREKEERKHEEDKA